jgi:hypothetical protein
MDEWRNKWPWPTILLYYSQDGLSNTWKELRLASVAIKILTPYRRNTCQTQYRHRTLHAVTWHLPSYPRCLQSAHKGQAYREVGGLALLNIYCVRKHSSLLHGVNFHAQTAATWFAVFNGHNFIIYPQITSLRHVRQTLYKMVKDFFFSSVKINFPVSPKGQETSPATIFLKRIATLRYLWQYCRAVVTKQSIATSCLVDRGRFFFKNCLFKAQLKM